MFFFFSSRRRHTRFDCDWSSDVCSSDLALEACADERGAIRAATGETSLFIHPPYAFRTVDRLLTNLHLPRSTLLMLVCAFGGYEHVMRAYRDAIAQGYRFYSYGDAMAIM